MNNYSPNMLKVFEKCPYEFYLKYVQKLMLPQRKKMFEKGKKIHALASYYLNGFDIKKLEKVLTQEESTVWQSLKDNKYFKFEAVGTEYNLSCRVGDFWVGGRLDALVSRCKEAKIQRGSESSQDKANLSYFILDYKTGQIPSNAEYDFQTMVYLLAADKFLAKKGGYSSLKFVYLGLKNNTEKVITLDEPLKNEYEKKVLEICEDIANSVKSNSFKKNCANCDKCEYKKLCS